MAVIQHSSVLEESNTHQLPPPSNPTKGMVLRSIAYIPLDMKGYKGLTTVIHGTSNINQNPAISYPSGKTYCLVILSIPYIEEEPSQPFPFPFIRRSSPHQQPITVTPRRSSTDAMPSLFPPTFTPNEKNTKPLFCLHACSRRCDSSLKSYTYCTGHTYLERNLHVTSRPYSTRKLYSTCSLYGHTYIVRLFAIQQV